ncbi:MAG TPA: YigZ family protein [Holophagaceae bacterium]|nr:YigZ family protein [Holophagaceae bacterium]
MKRLTAPASFKLREKASVFLAELHPAPDAAARAEVLARLRKRDFDATHHCSAWREGLPLKAWGADDDGEPSGTAGAPMLRVLEGAGLTDLIAICIRWYGGTKLGTGGLVRAYTEAVQGAIAEAERGGLLEEVRAMRIGRLSVAQSQAHLPFAFLGGVPGAEVLGQGFEGSMAWVRFQIPPGGEAALEAAWKERSRGLPVDWKA